MRDLDEFVDGAEKFFGNRDKKEVLKDKNQEKSYERVCDHPMFVVVGRRNHSDGGIYNEVRCIMCDKEFNKEDRIEKNKWMEALFDNKKLIAKYRGLAPVDKLPMFDFKSVYRDDNEEVRPVEKIRNLYLEYQNEAYELIDNGTLPKDMSIEDSFFDYMCKKYYDKYIEDTEKLKKQKIKTK